MSDFHSGKVTKFLGPIYSNNFDVNWIGVRIFSEICSNIKKLNQQPKLFCTILCIYILRCILEKVQFAEKTAKFPQR